MNKTPFRKKVEERISELASTNHLKIAFETNGRMKGISLSEGGDVDVLYSPKGEVMYIDYREDVKDKIDRIKKSLENEFNGVKLSSSDKSFRIKLSSEEGAPKSESDTLNFRILKSGARTPTAMQERGSAFILSVALKTNTAYSQIDLGRNHIALEKNKYIFDGLKKIFSGYEDRVKDWTYSYYQQQRLFLEKYENSHWSEFEYGNNSFVKFFENHVKNLYVTFGSSNPNKPAKKLQKYEQWNPSDIYAAYDMKAIKTELDELINGKENTKGINLFRLNQYLIKLLKDKRLVGISLKKIKEEYPPTAEMVLRNMDIESYMDPKIESKQYKLSDITFDIDGIHNERKKTVSTYIKFGDGYQIDLKGSSSKFNNIAFGTLIKAKSAAQGGNAPVNLVVRLMRKNGSSVTFTNDNSKYPKTDDEFYEPTASMYERSDYEKWFNVVKNHFTNKSVLYRNFETYIGGLYEDGDGAIAQSKLMQLHFYHDSFKENKLGVDYWTKILYLGMKVGRIFAPHEKIY